MITNWCFLYRVHIIMVCTKYKNFLYTYWPSKNVDIIYTFKQGISELLILDQCHPPFEQVYPLGFCVSHDFFFEFSFYLKEPDCLWRLKYHYELLQVSWYFDRLELKKTIEWLCVSRKLQHLSWFFNWHITPSSFQWWS